MLKYILLISTLIIFTTGCGSESKKENTAPTPPKVSEIETPPMPDGMDRQ